MPKRSEKLVLLAVFLTFLHAGSSLAGDSDRYNRLANWSGNNPKDPQHYNQYQDGTLLDYDGNYVEPEPRFWHEEDPQQPGSYLVTNDFFGFNHQEYFAQVDRQKQQMAMRDGLGGGQGGMQMPPQMMSQGQRGIDPRRMPSSQQMPPEMAARGRGQSMPQGMPMRDQSMGMREGGMPSRGQMRGDQGPPPNMPMRGEGGASRGRRVSFEDLEMPMPREGGRGRESPMLSSRAARGGMTQRKIPQ